MFGTSFSRLGKLACAVVVGAATSGCLERPVCGDCNPQTSNAFVSRVPTGGVDKVDLLFMIDGSISMADKQVLLQKAVPSLLSRFVSPLCIDDRGAPTGEPSIEGKCTRGTPEFPPVQDLHIGVISSNLGSVGGTACDKASFANDKAWLLPMARPAMNLPSWNSSGFLAWDPAGNRNTPPGTRKETELREQFGSLVRAVDEDGCGYEASLESWYRFLIDPDPPEKVALVGDFDAPQGTDSRLLAQRAAFLRPDSLLAIVMLTDENDCSFISNGNAHIATGPGRMWRATAACASTPNDRCCRSCGQIEAAPPSGCAPVQEDAGCQPSRVHELIDDSVNLRCFDQKRRFGLDLLEPVAKYIRGLTEPTVLDRNGQERENPLFAVSSTGVKRDPEWVYLAGIVGVPWQDIATEESLIGPGLRYLTAQELVEKQRWELILGDPATGRLPRDPHMIESVKPRSGAHPFVSNATLAPPASNTPTADTISGHEQLPPDAEDLQYACIFELETPADCSKGTRCDCNPDADQQASRPLCQAPSGGPSTTTQYYAKAYPGTRHLEVLRGIGKRGIVASICPKTARGDTSNPDYGYNPALAALVDQLKAPLVNQCLARAPAVDEGGQLACLVVEAEVDGVCDCTQPGRKPAQADLLASVRSDLESTKVCNQPGRPACSSVCGCELSAAASGAALAACRSTLDPNLQAPGYCYVDPNAGLGDPALVKGCPSSKQRLLRFVGPSTPTKGSVAYMACLGGTLKETVAPTP